jgi:hypothetical protein
MASSIQYYAVTVTSAGTVSAPGDGFLDHKKIENYYASTANALELTPTSPATLTLALCKAKRRGNIRYHEIIRQFQLVQNCWIDPNSLTATGATAVAEATSFAFQLIAMHGDAAWVTADELNAGQYLTGQNCIKRCIARALTADIFRQTEVFDPTSSTSAGNNTANIIRYGSQIKVASSLEIGPHVTGALSSALPSAAALVSISLLP